MDNVYDIIIAGGGPAGITAALYAARAGKKVLLLERMFLGGQMAVTPDVKNYPGSAGFSGAEIAMAMQKQLAMTKAEQKTLAVTAFSKKNGLHEVATQEGIFTAKAVILCLGAPPKKLGVEGEEKFLGAGVSYCATCDGNFFKGKTVSVIGGGNTAFDDAEYLSALAEKVYIVHRRDDFRALDSYVEKAKSIDNIEFLTPYTVENIEGDKKVSAINIKNVKTGEVKNIATDGIFVAVGASGNTSVMPEGVETDKNGYIIADETCITNVAGVFAAGDIRKKPLRQIVTAVADGANAAYSAMQYISSL